MHWHRRPLIRIVSVLALLALLGPVSGGSPGALPLEERFRIGQDLAGEILAREWMARPDPEESPASGGGDAGSPRPATAGGRDEDRAAWHTPTPSRYDVALAVSGFLEVLDNLNALAGHPPLVPVETNPDLYFEKASRRAMESLKAAAAGTEGDAAHRAR